MHSDLDKFKYVQWNPDIPYMTINIFLTRPMFPRYNDIQIYITITNLTAQT